MSGIDDPGVERPHRPMIRFTVLTLFPEMFSGPLNTSILRRARERKLIETRMVPIREFGEGRHRQVDDTPFGGGPGMVFRADILDRALRAALEGGDGHVIHLTPQGRPFDQEKARQLAARDHLLLICGHYEGLDERFIEKRVDEEVSLGDFVLTGGEIPAMALIDAVARLRPGVLGDADSQADSFHDGLLDHPQYTRPATWRPEGGRGENPLTVPGVLRSGHHGAVADWRRRQALLRTLLRRPDLLPRAELSRQERRLLEALALELENLDPVDHATAAGTDDDQARERNR